MKMRIREFAAYTGVSVRTLHYYDEIGLLRPAEVDKASGYRYYDENCVLRMQEILFYRELDFSLKTIAELLSHENHDRIGALREQKTLLALKKERLERLIAAIDRAEKGEIVMKAFDNTEFDSHKAEVKARWGKTAAYKEYSEKTRSYTGEKFSGLAAEMDGIFAVFARCMESGAAPDGAEARQLVEKLRGYITENYYTCTDPILAGLGQMYTADDRFRANIDRHGEGTAAFVSAAIASYCGK